ncbi:hypothetical protein GCM10011380_21230 [Sphingomonas metalli]|uniref:Uncharacterized protein n=1 Tax=Sphingomonas metalli TaxID=1779358 RepID=A0A916WUF5_9SPHN|nr:hypothetical protein [Sphingomonas metalli]GGB31654.1 hypothetical protein GCM10011380_21230 [Sphingomonas metalli]
MTDRPPPRPASPLAGGPLVALGPLLGAAVGFAFGEATPGALAGLALGVGGAVLIWWRGRQA